MTRRQEPRPDRIASEEEGFLHRWSRRKRETNAAQASTDADLPAAASPGAAISDTAILDAADAATPPISAPVEDGCRGPGAVAAVAAAPEPPGDDDMPSLDTLGPESEVSAFFSPRVSEALRRAALYRIFHQPSFNVTDGLDDYCADYRHLKPLGNVITSDMRLQMERAKERLLSMTDKPSDPDSEAHAARLPEVDTPAERAARLPEVDASTEHAARLLEADASAEDEEVLDDND